MIRLLIANLLGLKVVYVRFGYDDYLRFVRKTFDGREYVRIYGETCMLAQPGRRIIRVN